MRLDVRIVLTHVALALCLLGGHAGAETVLHSERSLYRNITVYEENGERCMKFSRLYAGNRQSCVARMDPSRTGDRTGGCRPSVLGLSTEPGSAVSLSVLRPTADSRRPTAPTKKSPGLGRARAHHWLWDEEESVVTERCKICAISARFALSPTFAFSQFLRPSCA